MKRYTVAIAGCGPAGLAAALLLQRGGHHVTLFDRFETPQRCILFEISFDLATGRVIDGDYPPDPACPDEWM